MGPILTHAACQRTPYSVHDSADSTFLLCVYELYAPCPRPGFRECYNFRRRSAFKRSSC